MTRKVPTTVAEMLEGEEGRVPYVYKDSEGYDTIGVGILVDKRNGGLTNDEIDYLLKSRIDRASAQVVERLPWSSALNEPRFAVLLGMAFQMGIDGLMQFSNTLAAVQAGRFQDASIGMLASRWATQTPERAARMAEQMRTGAWQ